MVLERLFKSPSDSLEISPPYGAYEDCLSCRVVGTYATPRTMPSLLIYFIITGSTALVSLGGYTYYSGMSSLRMQRKAIELSKSRYKYGSRQMGIVGISATLVGMGVYRMFN